jgi:chromosome partitioning protein
MLISVVNTKGGVGKSSISCHLAVWLAAQDLSVTLIDTDLQRSSSRWLEEMRQRLVDEHQGLNTERVQKRLEILERLATIQQTDPLEIRDQVPEVEERSQIVVADGPARDIELTRALIEMSRLALIPCGPSVLDIEASAITIRIIKQVWKGQRRKEKLPLAMFLPNKAQLHMRLTQDLLEAAQTFEIPVASIPIRFLQSYADAPGQRNVVWWMGHSAKKAGEDLKGLFKEVITYVRESAREQAE